jgi:thiamine biosynthesis lipoprotein
MGTLLRVEVEASDREAGIRAIEDTFAEVRRLEGMLSTWTAESELSHLNAAPSGEAFAVSPELLDLLAEADRWRRETEGAFDPAVGALVDAWDLRGRGRIPARAELDRARSASGLGLFELDAASGRVKRTREGAWIDSGGFGKGAALRSAARTLAAAGIRSALLDFGGQVLAVGAPWAEGSWPVAVAHPSRRAEPAAFLALADASASTSGQSERYVEVGGRRLGHILDPRTGAPAPAWGSVTVVASDPLAADALSTGLFVLGPRAALAWARDRSDVGVLVLLEGSNEVRAGWNRALARAGLELAAGVRPLPGDSPSAAESPRTPAKER